MNISGSVLKELLDMETFLELGKFNDDLLEMEDTKEENYRYKLSDNDLDIIKHYTKKPLSENARKSLIILSEVFGGLHHLDDDQLRYFDYQSDRHNEYLVGGSLATFDRMDLTLLVIIAHDMAVRLEIQPCSLADKDDIVYDEFLSNYRKSIIEHVMAEYDGLTEKDIPLNRPYLRLFFHERTREGDFSRRHPTLEDTMEGFRKNKKRFA